MTRKHLITLACSLVLASAACGGAQETTMSSEPSTSAAAPGDVRRGHAEVNGLRYYYEIRGAGEPLLLLHGGLGTLEMFGPVLPALTKTRQVIAVDLHGHGRTQLGDRAISLVDQGDDMAALLGQLGYTQVDVMGYSFGGGVAFRLGVQHPERVRRLVIVSAGFAQDGFYPEMLPMQAQVGAVRRVQPVARSIVWRVPEGNVPPGRWNATATRRPSTCRYTRWLLLPPVHRKPSASSALTNSRAVSPRSSGRVIP